MAKLKRGLASIRQILLVIVGVAVVFFALVNLNPVTVDLLVAQVETSVALLLLVPLLTGMALGWIGGGQAARRRRTRGTKLAGAEEAPAELPSGQDPLAAEDWVDVDLDEIET